MAKTTSTRTLRRNQRSTGSGQFGSYYPVSKTRGIKVLNSTWFRSVAEAKASDIYCDAMQEARWLTKAGKAGVSPKCYGVQIVKDGSEFRVGILMQHIPGKTLNDANMSYANKEKVSDRLFNRIEKKLGICKSDHHYGNIMVYKRKAYAIDFGTQY